MLYIYTDGSGKTGKYAFLIKETNEVKIFQKKWITNNESEYLAVIEALKARKEKEITIFSDSKLVVSQLNHEYKIKENRLRKLALQVWGLCKGRNVKFKWLERKHNLAGKLLG